MMRSKAMHSRVANLERASTPATGLVWVEDWENADQLVFRMLATGEISSPDEVTLVGWAWTRRTASKRVSPHI
jgi:hypothetical protein